MKKGRNQWLIVIRMDRSAGLGLPMVFQAAGNGQI
jgi:hypothetical protein